MTLQILRDRNVYFNIIVKNRIENSVLKTNPTLKSDKINASEHGYGVSIIKDIAKKVYERIPSRMKINFNEVAAFEMKDGFAYSIMDKDAQLIQAEAIDTVSEEISEDFDYLLNL